MIVVFVFALAFILVDAQTCFNYVAIRDILPTMYSISYDRMNHISDGGYDTYDGGNFIYVNDFVVEYTDDWAQQMAQHQTWYMSLQETSMYVKSLSYGSAEWRISGNVGADNYGTLELVEYTSPTGAMGWRKTVCAASDPTVNHMWVVNPTGGLAIDRFVCSDSTDNDCDQLTVPDNTILLLAVYWGDFDTCIPDAVQSSIFDLFVDEVMCDFPPNPTFPPSNSSTNVDVCPSIYSMPEYTTDNGTLSMSAGNYINLMDCGIFNILEFHL